MFDLKTWLNNIVEWHNSIMSNSIDEVFDDTFMQENTKYTNVGDFFDDAKYLASSYNLTMDEIVRELTPFASYYDINCAAMEKYMKEKI